MAKTNKVTKFFSAPLMKQNIKANWLLCLVILLVMLLMANVTNFAGSIMQKESSSVDVAQYQEDFFTYLGALATYDTMTGGDLSYDDFASSSDTSKYDTAFSLLNQQTGKDLSTEGLKEAAVGLSQGGIATDTYVKEFEYNYALAQQKGVFSGDDLTASDMMSTTLEMMGVNSDTLETLSEMDASAMINRVYYTVSGLLPIFLLIVILANSLIADKVDRGSMAYVLSTPTKRSAVAITQMIFMIFVPLIIIAIVGASRIGTTYLFYDTVNPQALVGLFVGMYLLVEAVCGICYLGSCFFSRSNKSLGFGGGITVWFFLASLIGMFGAKNMVDTGMGVEQLDMFNKLTLVGLFDIDSISTIGTDNVDDTFIWKLAVLACIAVVCYVVGAIKFTKKDLPL